MKKFFTFVGFAAIAAMFTPATMAQEETTSPEFAPVEDIYTHSWRDNWYIQLGAGAQMPLFEKDAENSNFVGKKTTVVYELGIGHWFSPYFGFRFRGQGGPLHYENTGVWKKMKYANLNLELTWDMLNSLGGVNDKRVFSIVPYIGVGTTYGWDYQNTGSLGILDNDSKEMEHQFAINGNLGIQFRFRCHKNIDLYLDARATATSDNINNIAWRTGVDPIMSLTAGMQINLGKEGRHVTKYTPYDCSGKIKELNDRVNTLRGNLEETEAQLRAAQAQLPCPEVKEAEPQVVETPSVMPAVRFRINSARVSANDKITLYDVAQMMKENEDVKIVVKGYADKNTGSENYNQKLSERRANAVKDVLVGYGIDESRIETQAVGVSSQPYSDNNNWNRVALIFVK